MHTIRTAFCALAAFALASAAHAQGYPDRPITIIVPFAPGGGTDVVARAMAPTFGAKLGANVVIENVSGAAGNIAAARVARAAPDGYTLIMHNLALALNAALYPKLQFDSEKDFAFITMINSTANVIVARKNFPTNGVPELTAWTKNNTLRLGHPGVGSTGHISISLLARTIGAPADYIPYRGGGPLLQDLVAGHVDMGTVTIGNGIEPIANGLVKPIGTTGPQRSKLLPQVPSLVQELGPSMEVIFWNVLMAPAGTPKPIIDKLHAAFEETIKDQALVGNWERTGVELYPPEQRTPEGTRQVISRELARWAKVIREHKIEAPQ